MNCRSARRPLPGIIRPSPSRIPLLVVRPPSIRAERLRKYQAPYLCLKGGVSMWRQHWLTAVLAMGTVAVPASAQVQLQWKLKDGDKFYLETTSTTKQTMKLMGI